MKKQLSLAAAVLFTAGAIFMTGCKKDDTTPPVITLSGSSSMTMSLQGTYTEPGFTAEDDEDGDITASVTSDASSTNPNKNMTGTYTITYTVSDAAGNTGTATRTVQVVNDAAALAKSYSVHDSCGVASVFNYAQVITASTTLNGRIHFNKFGDYSGNTAIYADVVGTTITLPSQTANNIGTASEDHIFQGSGTISGTVINLTYTDNNVTQSATATCYAKFQ